MAFLFRNIVRFLSYSGRFPQVGAKLLALKNIFLLRSPLKPSQGQTHCLKQLTMLQKRLQTPQIVLISLNFSRKHQMNTKKSIRHCINT